MKKEPFYNTGSNYAAQEVWTYIRTIKTTSVPKIMKATKLKQPNVIKIVGRMKLAGLIQVNKTTKPHTITLFKDVGRICPHLDDEGKKRPTTAGDRMWMALKALKSFSNLDLSLAAECHIVVARNYTKGLTRAGYLTKMVDNKEPENIKTVGCIAAKYKFKKTADTGPLSPMVSRKTVYDRNKKQFVWTKDQANEQDNGGKE